MRSIIAGPLASLVILTAPAASQQHSPERDRQAIAALIEAVQNANNAGDVDRWVGLFAPDFVYMAPGAPAVTTVDALREVARAGFQHEAAVDIEPLEIEVHGDWAFARTSVSGSVTLQGSGRVVHVDSKQLVIYRRIANGSWRISRMIANSNTQ